MNQKPSDGTTKQKDKLRYFAITSLVIGILMLVTTLVEFWILLAIAWTMMPGPDIPIFFFYIHIFVIFVGLVCGIIGVNSNKERIAIAGVTICTLLLLLHVYSFVKYITY